MMTHRPSPMVGDRRQTGFADLFDLIFARSGMAGLPAEAAATVHMSRFLAHAGIAARPDGEDVRKAARALPGAPAIASAARSESPALVKLHQLTKAAGPPHSLDAQLRLLADAPPAPSSPLGRAPSWAELGEADVVFVVERALSDEEAALAVQYCRDLRDEWDEGAALELMPRPATQDAGAAVTSPPHGGGAAVTPPPRGGGRASGDAGAGADESPPHAGGSAACRGGHHGDGGVGGVPSPLRRRPGGAPGALANASCYVLLEATTDEKRLLSKLAQLETNSRALAARTLGVQGAPAARDLGPAAIAEVVTVIGVAAPFSSAAWSGALAKQVRAFTSTNLPFVNHMSLAGRLLYMQLGNEHRQVGAVVASLLYAQENTQRQVSALRVAVDEQVGALRVVVGTMQASLEEIRRLLLLPSRGSAGAPADEAGSRGGASGGGAPASEASGGVRLELLPPPARPAWRRRGRRGNRVARP